MVCEFYLDKAIFKKVKEKKCPLRGTSNLPPSPDPEPLSKKKNKM